MATLFINFKKLFHRSKASKAEPVELSKKDLHILNTALKEYLENRVYDLEGIDFEDMTNPRHAEELGWFFSGLDTQKKLTALRG